MYFQYVTFVSEAMKHYCTLENISTLCVCVCVFYKYDNKLTGDLDTTIFSIVEILEVWHSLG